MNALRWKQSAGAGGGEKPMLQRPVVWSLIFHVTLFLVLSGTFHFFPKDFPQDEAVAVELLPIADKAQSTIAAPVAKQKEQPKEQPKEPPKPTPPPKAEKPKSVEKPPEPVEQPKEKPKEEKKPEPKKGDLPSKKPEPKKEPKKEKPKPKEDQQFDSVLKNLVGEDAPQVEKTDAKNTDRQEPVLTAPAPLGSQMSMSEMDALRNQLAGCWNLLPGARSAEDLVVDIEMQISPEKVVTSAKVVDMGRYQSDSFFRAAADAAVRAVRSPECTPLALPDGKYDEWKSTTVRFDPKEMF